MADLSNLRTSYQNVLAEQLKKGLGQVGNVYASRGTTGGGEEMLAMGEMGKQYGLGTAQNELALQQLEQSGNQFQQQFGEGQRQFNAGQGNWQQQFGEGQRQFNAGQGNWQQQFGEGQRQFNAGQGNWQQQFGEGQRQFNAGQGNWQQQFGEGQRQFNVGQGNWGQQFGLQKGLAEAGMTGQYQGQSTQPYLQQQFQNQLAQAGLTGQMANGQQTLAGLQNQQQYGLAQGQLTGQYGGNATQSMINQMMPYITGGYMSNPYASQFGNIQTEQQISPEYQFSNQMGMNPYQLSLLAQIDPDQLKQIMQGNQSPYLKPNTVNFQPTNSSVGQPAGNVPLNTRNPWVQNLPGNVRDILTRAGA